MYGSKTHTEYQKQHGQMPSVIGRVDTSPNGNVILEVGKMVDSDAGGWSKTEHVVLTKDEALGLINDISRAIGVYGVIQSSEPQSYAEWYEEHVGERLEDAITEGDPK